MAKKTAKPESAQPTEPLNRAVTQPVLPQAPTPTAKEMLADALGMPADKVTELAATQQEVAGYVLAMQAKELNQKLKSEREQTQIREWANKSAAERTQAVADHAWPARPGDKKFICSIGQGDPRLGRPDSVSVAIFASSVFEAEGRYKSVCGIRNTEHPIVAVPEGELPADTDAAANDAIMQPQMPPFAFSEAGSE